MNRTGIKKYFALKALLPIFNFIFLPVVILCFISESDAQYSNEAGQYNIHNYTTMVPQNFAVVQDSRGVLYFGNNTEIIEYDGENWDTIQTPIEVPIHSLAIDSKGVIFVGGRGEIGYLSPDQNGRMRYHSLVGYIPKDESDFGDVWSCIATRDNNVYFQSSNRIFEWNGKKIKVFEPAKHGASFHLMFNVNGTLFVREKEEGLMKMIDSTLSFIQGGEMFAQTKIYFMQPFDKNEILMNYEGLGLFVMTPADYSSRIQNSNQLTKITPFHTDIDKFFLENKVYNGIKLNDKDYSIGTLNGGVVVIDTSGNMVCSINKKSGLKDEDINYQFLDSQQKLWLATNNGISKVDINSPITNFNDENGIEGTVQTICRYNGKIYAATLTGLFYLTSQNISSGAVEPPHFNKLNDIGSDECWDLLPFNSGKKHILLVAANEGIYQVEDNTKSTKINTVNPYVMHRSIIDSNRVFIGQTNGVSSIYWNNGSWIDEGNLGNINKEVTTIAEEKNGTLWCGHNNKGIIRIIPYYNDSRIDSVQVRLFDDKDGLPDESNNYIKNINGHIYFSTLKGYYKYDGNNKFSRDTSLGKQFSNGQLGIFRMDQDAKGNLWMVVITQKDGLMHTGYLKNPGTDRQQWITTPFMSLSKNIIFCMYHDSDGITWLGGSDGIFRYDNKIKKNYTHDFFALVRRVIVSKGKDSTIFFGAYSDDSNHVTTLQPDKLKLSLPFASNSLTFFYSAPDFENEASMQYSYRLEGSDEQHAQWSEWKSETHAPYTFLHEGHYIFHVKARNIYGHESREAIYEFTILSPWYRTIWAYIAYVLLFIAFVYSAITISTRSLRNIITERTAEVVKQKEVIEMKNKDITDSINYAKRIQEAILPTRERFKSFLPESFILFKPKDIVSGDFYWMLERNDIIYVAAGDCTGHGVPGAMVSVVCSNALNRAVKEFGITEPGKILDKVRDLVIETFEKSEKEDIKDGMDISLCTINNKTNEVRWSGANNPLWFIQDFEIKEITADKQPIGNSDNPKPFTTHIVKLKKGDEIYLFTDGYADQFGGPKGKKFKYKQLEQKVLEGRSLDMNTQSKNLNSTFENWKGNLEQVDDVLIIGIRV